MSKIEKNKIKPVIASGKNGKSPSLYKAYWLIEEEKDFRMLEEELKYHIHPKISIDYYMQHPEKYEQEREWVLLLSEYLYRNDDKLKYAESVNERSFEIWKREKFLTKENGKTILNHCCIDKDYLNMYETVEPLAYYTNTTDTPQNILIIENKDTFFSMRKHMIENSNEIFEVKIGTLIYGGGKRVIRSFNDFDFCVEPHMRKKENKILYFGDLDYEGIGIECVEVNLSLYQLLARKLTERYIEFLKKYGIPTRMINLEITETAATFESADFGKTLEELMEMGFSLSLDDYGTAYSNIENVLSVNYKNIKIDSKILWDSDSNVNSRNLLGSTIASFRKMGNNIIQEGVETKEQLDFVTEAGANLIQGYYFSKPLRRDEFVEFVKKFNNV